MIDFTKKQKRIIFNEVIEAFNTGRWSKVNVIEDLLNIEIVASEDSTFAVFLTEDIPCETKPILIIDVLNDCWKYDIKRDPDEMNYVKYVRKQLELYYKQNN